MRCLAKPNITAMQDTETGINISSSLEACATASGESKLQFFDLHNKLAHKNLNLR